MLFSIIIPFFNKEKRFFAKCLDSVMSLDLGLVGEIVIVNDGSEDLYWRDAVEEIKSRDLIQQKAKLINLKTNRGQAEARKVGLKSIRTKEERIILFLDADDIYTESNMLNKILNLFQVNNELQIVKFSWKRIEKNGVTKTDHEPKRGNRLIVLNNKWFFSNYGTEKKHLYSTLCLYAFRHRAIMDRKIWNTINVPYEDHYFFAALLGLNLRCMIIDDQFYGYHMDVENSTTTKVRLARKDFWIDIMRYDALWFTSFKNYNIDCSEQLRQYWVLLCLMNALPYASYSYCSKEIPNFPTKHEIKTFLKRYKIYSGIRKLWIKCMLSGGIFSRILLLLRPIKPH